MKKLHLCITIDTECDKGENWKVKQPLSFRNTNDGLLDNLLPILIESKSLPTFLISPEVMRDEKSVNIFKSFEEHVELGTHLHSEFIGPNSDFLTKDTTLYQKDLSYENEKEKLFNITELFKKSFGYEPKSFRAGRFGISKHTLKILENLNYKVDSSITPDIQWKNKNEFKNTLNFFGAPYQPYYPSYNDFRKKGNMNILQVPVTVINTKLVKIPKLIKRKIRLNNRFQHIAYNLLTNFNKPIWLRPTFSNFKQMKYLTELVYKNSNSKNIFLCIMFHSNEFCIGTSPYSMNEIGLDKIKIRLKKYLKWFNSLANSNHIKLSEIKNFYNK